MKYLHIDSSLRDESESKTNFTVHVPTTFKECTRVAVKSLSIPNTFPNMTPNIKFRWVEIMNESQSTTPGQWIGALFEGNITTRIIDGIVERVPSYIDNSRLQTLIQEVLKGGQHINTRISFKLINNVIQFGESVMSNKVSNNPASQSYDVDYGVSYNTTDFKFRIDAKASLAKVHLFMPFMADSDEISLWEQMGYHREKIVTGVKLQTIFRELVSVNTKEFSRSFNDKTNLYIKEIRTIADNTQRVMEGDQCTTHENHIREINICSNVLASDSFVTLKGGQSVGTNILQTINNSASKFSYLHYMSDQLYYHKLSKNISNRFDIQLLDSNYNIIHPDQCPNFKIVLVFESKEEVEYDAAFLKNYARIGYNLAHKHS
jgi:hypothetical protein